MPGNQPFKLTIAPNDWNALMKTLNFLIKDIYDKIATIQGYDNRVFEPEDITLPSGTNILDSTWGATNVTTIKTIDCDATTLHEVADLLGSLIDELKDTS